MKAAWVVGLFLCLSLSTVSSDESVQGLMSQAEELFGKGKYEEAIPAFRKVLAVKSVKAEIAAEAMQFLGTCQLRTRREKEAVKTFGILVQRYPQYTERLLEALRHLDDARRILELRREAVPTEKKVKDKVAAAAMRKRLDEIIIDKVRFKDTPVDEAFDFIKKESRKKDKSGLGVNFLLILEVATYPDEDEEEQKRELPKITLDADRIPVGRLIRHIGKKTGLFVDVEPYAVAIITPKAMRIGLGLRFYPVNPKWIAEITEGAKSSDEKHKKLDDYFRRAGIGDEPYFPFTVSYDRGTSKLIVRGSSSAQKRVATILREVTPREPQFRVECDVIEVRLTEKLAKSGQPLTPKTLMEVPRKHRRVVNRLTMVGVEGTEIATSGIDQIAHGPTEKKLLTASSKLTATPERDKSRKAIELALAWEYKLSDPKASGSVPVLERSIKSKLLIEDGACQLLQFAKRNRASGTDGLYLLVRVTEVNGSGAAISSHDTPAGRLGKALRQLLNENELPID